MTTKKQQEASRQNGLLGGGKTEEGKSISKMNSVKHGIMAFYSTQYDLISGEDIFCQLAEEFGTSSPSRHVLVQQLALTILRLSRCARAETEILKEGLNPRVVETKNLSDLFDLTETVVVSEGEVATLSADCLEKLALIYERYEPRLVSRLLQLLAALKS